MSPLVTVAVGATLMILLGSRVSVPVGAAPVLVGVVAVAVAAVVSGLKRVGVVAGVGRLNVKNKSLLGMTLGSWNRWLEGEFWM
jgi:hypothetical protein